MPERSCSDCSHFAFSCDEKAIKNLYCDLGEWDLQDCLDADEAYETLASADYCDLYDPMEDRNRMKY